MSIPDLNLRAAPEKALGKNEADAITKGELDRLKELNAEGLNVTNINVLKYTTNLTQLNLEDNRYLTTARKHRNLRHNKPQEQSTFQHRIIYSDSSLN